MKGALPCPALRCRDTLVCGCQVYTEQLSELTRSRAATTALEDQLAAAQQRVVHVAAMETHVDLLEVLLERRVLCGDREGMVAEDTLAQAVAAKTVHRQLLETTAALREEVRVARAVDPVRVRQLDLVIARLTGEKNHFENKVLPNITCVPSRYCMHTFVF